MSRFGSRVTATAARITDDITGTYTFIDNFLRECGVPEEVRTNSRGSYGGRLGYLERVFTTLDNVDPDRLQTVLQDLVSRLMHRSETREIEHLDAAFRESGFIVTDNGLVQPTEILAGEVTEANDYLDQLLKLNESHLTIETLRHHLEQHRTLYSQGTSPGAATGEARQFIEQLLTDIASNIAHSRSDRPKLNRPVLVRNYLLEQGFFDEAESKRLVEGIYGYLSEVGAHPGIKDITMGRMARVIFLYFGVYLLEKFQAFYLTIGR